MNINYEGWKIRLSSLINVEWRKFYFISYPKLVIHEKYETLVKTVLRTLTGIGIMTSFIALSPNEGFLLSIALLIIETFLEKTLFEYTVIFAHAFPDFEVDYSQWCDVGFAFPNIAGVTLVVGPAFKDEEYAIRFFDYIKSWGKITNHDKENYVVLSFVIEPDNIYTTYLYPSSSNTSIGKTFNEHADKSRLEKYGKRQQELIAAPMFYRINEYREGFNFYRFLNAQQNGQPFRLAPFVKDFEARSFKLLEAEAFVKYEYKFNYRKDVTPNDLEYYHKHPRYD